MTAAELYERFKTACELKQAVDRDKIVSALEGWAQALGAFATVKFVTNMAEALDALAEAEEARSGADTSWTTSLPLRANLFTCNMPPCCDYAFSSGDETEPRYAWADWDNTAAGAAWLAILDAFRFRGNFTHLSHYTMALPNAAVVPVAASLEGDPTKREDWMPARSTLEDWLPILEAFEAGAFLLWAGYHRRGNGARVPYEAGSRIFMPGDTVNYYVAEIPSVLRLDDQHRLHCADGPAFAWLDDVREYYYHGTHVPTE